MASGNRQPRKGAPNVGAANQQWTARFNPRSVTEAEILKIYQAAW
jgi:hypothetical protein